MIEAKFAKSTNLNAQEAIKEVSAQINGDDLSVVMVFCTHEYDLVALGKALEATFNAPIIGCTTMGELLGSDGYMQNSLVCASIKSPDLKVSPIFIENLNEFAQTENPKELNDLAKADKNKNFMMLLIDGLSAMEERVLSRITETVKGVQLIGASAGDGLRMENTFVYFDGEFHRSAAVLAHFQTDLPFGFFHIHHFEPTDVRIVITAMNEATRTVFEINGLPAAEEYARTLGVTVDGLTRELYSANPLLLRVGGRYFARSIKTINPDGSITFLCALDRGLVMTLGRTKAIIENLKNELAHIKATIPNLAFIFGSDCGLRRVEVSDLGLQQEAKEAISGYPFIGFSTYGEQLGGIHMNHTLIALAFGDKE
ncbi:hypothetical protein AGMMS50229_10550 [Campylobacterota bacterium]|nr:hypothetical protein AGMMS50229_10550 [Campylobacterota bacterium]